MTCFSHHVTYILIRFIIFHILSIGCVYCTSDASSSTPVYVVQDGEAVLQCGFENNKLAWYVYNGGIWDSVANVGDVTDSSIYSTSKNPSTGLYYRLHILNVVVSDVKKYRCSGAVNVVFQAFFLQLIPIGRCYCILVICKCKTERSVWSGKRTMVVVGKM